MSRSSSGIEAAILSSTPNALVNLTVRLGLDPSRITVQELIRQASQTRRPPQRQTVQEKTYSVRYEPGRQGDDPPHYIVTVRGFPQSPTPFTRELDYLEILSSEEAGEPAQALAVGDRWVSPTYVDQYIEILKQNGFIEI